MKNPSHSGFALPSVIIASVVMFIVLLAGLSSIVSTSTALNRLYLEQLTTEAEQSGASMAASCLDANFGAPQWPNSRPLRPNTDCRGVDLPGVACPNTISDNQLCYINLSNSYKTRFAVTYDTNSDGSFKGIITNAIVEKVRKKTGVSIERFQQKGKYNKVNDALRPY